jgi:hypothetical protein
MDFVCAPPPTPLPVEGGQDTRTHCAHGEGGEKGGCGAAKPPPRKLLSTPLFGGYRLRLPLLKAYL